jgi:hypothetical protein
MTWMSVSAANNVMGHGLRDKFLYQDAGLEREANACPIIDVCPTSFRVGEVVSAALTARAPARSATQRHNASVSGTQTLTKRVRTSVLPQGSGKAPARRYGTGRSESIVVVEPYLHKRIRARESGPTPNYSSTFWAVKLAGLFSKDKPVDLEDFAPDPMCRKVGARCIEGLAPDVLKGWRPSLLPSTYLSGTRNKYNVVKSKDPP